MSQLIRETHIKNGHLELNNLPLINDTAVKVIPKANLEKMSFLESQALTQSISGNLSDDIARERDCT
jgi:hypothetical protein